MAHEQDGVARLARTLSAQRGVIVEFKGSWPITDGVHVRVPESGEEAFLIGAVDAMAAVAAMGSPAVLKEAATGALLCQLHCAIEAGRCMPAFQAEFEGAGHHVAMANQDWIGMARRKELDSLSEAVALVGLKSFGLGIPTRFSMQILAKHSALFERIALCQSEADSLALARDFVKAFQEMDDGDGSRPAFGSGEQDECGDEGFDGEAGEGPCKMKAGGSKSGKGKPKKGDGDGESEGKEDAGRGKSKLGKMPWNQHEDDGGSAKLRAMFTDKDTVLLLSGQGDARAASSLSRSAEPVARAMVSKFERVLKTKEQVKWRFERERGALDQRSLSKLSASPGFRAPFKDKKVFETAAVAVHVLMDLSGSMDQGDRMRMSRQAAMSLAMAMGRLDIDCEVGGFSSGTCGEYVKRYEDMGMNHSTREPQGRIVERMALRVFKEFGKPSLRGLTLAELDDDVPENPDAEGVAWAASRLMANPRKRKILLVLSDGEPCCLDTDAGTLSKDLRSRLASIEAAGIETVGIGIQSDSVRRYYRDHVVVHDTADLAKKALDKMCELLLRSGPEGR